MRNIFRVPKKKPQTTTKNKNKQPQIPQYHFEKPPRPKTLLKYPLPPLNKKGYIEISLLDMPEFFTEQKALRSKLEKHCSKQFKTQTDFVNFGTLPEH